MFSEGKIFLSYVSAINGSNTLKIMAWSNNEMAVMQLMYGLAHGNAVGARLLYAETFPSFA